MTTGARGLVLLGCLAALCGARARADEASGTWSFAFEGRANRFSERSSRVTVPEVKLGATAPNGLRLGTSYLVDVISSASIAQTGSDGSALFTELRHGADFEIGKELEPGGRPLDLSARVGFSTENDYTSVLAGVRSSIWLDQRATKLSLGASHVRDAIRSNVDPSFAKSLLGATMDLGVEQVMTPNIVFAVGYQLAYLEGFLSNPYRRALVGPLPYAERHPHERVRHNVGAQLSVSVPSTKTAVHLLYRAYVDSWDIAALTPEGRVCQSFAEDWVVQLRYRFYTQTPAFFFRRSYPIGFEGYVTNDPKMAELRTHTLGASVELTLGVLAGTFAALSSKATLDIAVERYLSNSAYGDGVIATTGYRIEL